RASACGSWCTSRASGRAADAAHRPARGGCASSPAAVSAIFETYWAALAARLVATPELVAGWLLAVVLFAVVATAALLRLLPRAATDNPVRRVAQNSAFPIAAALASKGLDLAFAMVMLRVLG